MELFNYWMYGVVFFSVVAALFARDVTAFTLKAILVWPVTIFVVVQILVLDKCSVQVDAMKTHNMFGFRKSPNPTVKGFAVTVFFTEVQFYTVNK